MKTLMHRVDIIVSDVRDKVEEKSHPSPESVTFVSSDDTSRAATFRKTVNVYTEGRKRTCVQVYYTLNKYLIQFT